MFSFALSAFDNSSLCPQLGVNDLFDEVNIMECFIACLWDNVDGYTAFILPLPDALIDRLCCHAYFDETGEVR